MDHLEEPYRALACAVVERAFADLAVPHHSGSARAFLLHNVWKPHNVWGAWLVGTLDPAAIKDEARRRSKAVEGRWREAEAKARQRRRR